MKSLAIVLALLPIAASTATNRLRQLASLGMVALLVAVSGCGESQVAAPLTAAGGFGPAYVVGKLQGEMAAEVEQLLRPQPWTGQTDGTLVMNAAAVHTLTQRQQSDLHALAANGYAVVLLEAVDEDVQALHALKGTPAPLQAPPEPTARHALYVAGYSPSGIRAGSVVPFPEPGGQEHAANKTDRVHGVLKHVLRRLEAERQGARARGLAQGDGPFPLSPSNMPLSVTQSYSMPAYWSTCGGNVQSCSDNVQVFADVWMVYSATNAALPDQPTDFFIMTTSANVSTAGCLDFYGNSNPHPGRIAGYWLRQFNTSASVSGVSFDDMSIISGPSSQGGYAPQDANPSVQVTTGTSWSLGGSGTAGEASGVGFTAGVSFTNQTTITYQALQTDAAIGATDNTASWSYDSWDFVNNTIQPADHACGGNGLNVDAALPAIVYGGTFNPSQTWVWQTQPAVRQQFNGGPLPVQVNNSLLLGWTFFPETSACNPRGGVSDVYFLKNTNYTYTAGPPGPSRGLLFDVGCGTDTEFGTIPLGPLEGGDQDNGNPGMPYTFTTMAVNVPFAPIPTAVHLSSLSPASGPAGTVVTITGLNLSGVIDVNFGGESITDFAVLSATQLQVAAPQGLTGSVPVSVRNVVGFSNTLTFTYAR